MESGQAAGRQGGHEVVFSHRKRSKPRTKRKKKQSSGGIDLGWREHRRVVEDLSDSLAKNWKFKLEVCGIVIVLCAVVISLVTLVVGGRLIDSQTAIAEGGLTGRINNLSDRVDTKLRKVDQQADEVGARVEARINQEFEEKQFRATVEKVGETAAAQIISEQVEPAEKKINERLQGFEKFLDETKSRYQGDQQDFRRELEVLKKRNELTRMADKAIGDGSLRAYQRLQSVSENEADPDIKAAGTAEIFRVVSAYSIFAPSRTLANKFIVERINPNKKEESELSNDELVHVLLNAHAGLDRARAADLLEQRPMTFQIAESVNEAMKKEYHLEALRFEKAVFARIPGFQLTVDLDGKREVKWFSENKERLRKELPIK